MIARSAVGRGGSAISAEESRHGRPHDLAGPLRSSIRPVCPRPSRVADSSPIPKWTGADWRGTDSSAWYHGTGGAALVGERPYSATAAFQEDHGSTLTLDRHRGRAIDRTAAAWGGPPTGRDSTAPSTAAKPAGPMSRGTWTLKPGLYSRGSRGRVSTKRGQLQRLLLRGADATPWGARPGSRQRPARSCA